MPTRFCLPLLFLAAPALAATPAAAPTAEKSAFDQPETRVMAEARAEGMFKLMDADHDGVLTRDEVLGFFAHQAELRGAKLRDDPPIVQEMFDDADTDHDGKISVQEAKAAADRGFDAVDTNHDGIVTPEERAAATRDVLGAPPGPAGPVKGKPQESGR